MCLLVAGYAADLILRTCDSGAKHDKKEQFLYFTIQSVFSNVLSCTLARITKDPQSFLLISPNK